MALASVVHHALLGLSVVALGSAGLRAASTMAPRGLERALVAVTLAATAAVTDGLALGLFALGGSAGALTLAALATWLVARRLLPNPAVSATGELNRWWSDRRPAERAGIGALMGAGLTWAGWQLIHPELGGDAVIYHLPEIVLWVQSGTPGSVEPVYPNLPVGNYPLTAEVTISWALAISRSFVPVVLLPWAAIALVLVAGWAGLRELRVPRLPRALAVAALATSPWLLAWQRTGTITDPFALAWLVACAALCVLSRSRPVLLAPAIVAGGLSVGCKTTTLPMVVVALALGLWASRAQVRSLVPPLALGLGAAAVVGGFWYARNFVTHGSPFWPFVAGPWGDPVPLDIAKVDETFLGRPRATIDRLGDTYVSELGGALLLLLGGLLAPLTSPRGRTAAASLVALGGFVVWASAPTTGVGESPVLDVVNFSTTRYLLPVIGVSALALALAASEPGRRAWPATVLLGASTAVSVLQTFELGFPHVPSPLLPLAGAAVGLGAGLATQRLPSWPEALRPAGAAALVVAVAAALAIPASGFVERHAATMPGITAPLSTWMTSDRDYRSRADGVAASPVMVGPLAGDRLEHRLSTIGRDAPCDAIRAQARDAWLIVTTNPLGVTIARATTCLDGAGPAYQDQLFAAFRPAAEP